MTPTDMFPNLLMNYCTEESVLILLDGDGVIPSVLSWRIPVKVSVKLISPVSGFLETAPQVREGSSGAGSTAGSQVWEGIVVPSKAGVQLSSVFSG